MFKKILIRSNQIAEMSKSNGFWPTLKSCVYTHNEAVPVVKDLSTLQQTKKTDSLYQLLRISPETAGSLHLSYPIKSRGEKAGYYLKQGFESYAMVDDDVVLADVWCVRGPMTSSSANQKDLRLFEIDLDTDEVYMFDLHVYPDKRGRATATNFMNDALLSLKEQGIRRAYGYFLKSNTPALWVHRLLGYEELATFSMKRYGFVEKVKQISL